MQQLHPRARNRNYELLGITGPDNWKGCGSEIPAAAWRRAAAASSVTAAAAARQARRHSRTAPPIATASQCRCHRAGSLSVGHTAAAGQRGSGSGEAATVQRQQSQFWAATYHILAQDDRRATFTTSSQRRPPHHAHNKYAWPLPQTARGWHAAVGAFYWGGANFHPFVQCDPWRQRAADIIFQLRRRNSVPLARGAPAPSQCARRRGRRRCSTCA